MQRLMLTAALAALGFAASAHAAENALESRVIASDGWVAYHVPKVAGVEGPCCYVVRDGARAKKGCDLDGKSWQSDIDGDDPSPAFDDTLAIYLQVEHSRIARVRAVGNSCPIRTATPVRWIETANAEDSVAMLASLIDRDTSDAENHDFVALAHHAGSSATRALAARAEPSQPFKKREQALFWLGQTHGAEGADIIKRYATRDADPELRSKAIFALSQSKAPDAYTHISTLARRDPAEKVRGEALFWLAQMNDDRAKDDIIASLDDEPSDEVRKQAVFALSQLDGEAADEALIAVLGGNYPREVKKQALFWLGQSGSPRAMAYFDQALK